MATDDKATIVQMPALLDRLGSKLRALISRSAENKAEFVEINVEFCLTLAQARDQFTANIEFGCWCDAVGLGKDVLNHQTRAAAVAMGRDPAGLRACLEATERRSLETIYSQEFGRFTNVRKTPEPNAKRGRRHKKSAPKRHARADDVVGRADANMSYKDIALDTQVGARQVRHIVEEERIWRAAQAELLDAAAAERFSESSKLRVQDAIRIHKAHLEKQFELRVNEEVRRRIDAADDATRKHAKELHLQNINLQRMVSERGVFTETQFKQMLMLCHPDSSAGPELKAALLQVLIENKNKLVKPAK